MKKVLCLMMAAVLLLCLTACAKKPAAQEAATGTEAMTGTEAALPNPWRDITEAEVDALCIKSFKVPEGAENVRWSAMEAAKGESGVPGALVQLNFDLYGNSFTAREQVTGDEAADLSGMYYEWSGQREETMENWADGNMKAQLFRFVGESGYVDLCTWYDVEAGVSYSLGVAAADLDGFDILAVADQLCP